MSINLQFYDTNMELIDSTRGLNLGTVRRGYDHITRVYVKNDGDQTANNVSLVSGQQNPSDENQVIASKWHTFSLDGTTYKEQLNFGTLEPGDFVTGNNTENDNFSSPDSSIFKFLLGSCDYDFTRPILTFSQQDATSQAYGRNQLALENAKDLDFTFKLGYTGDNDIFAALPSGQQNASMAIFAVRINAMGATRDNDNTGYLLEFFTSPKYENKFQFKVTTGGKGIAGSTDRSYGSIIGDTGIVWLDYYPLLTEFRIRVYNDENNIPCFELFKDGEQVDIYKFAWNDAHTSTSRTDEKVKTLQDPEQNYITGGKTYFDVNLQKGTNNYRLSDFSITYDNARAPIYIKTHIDDTGLNGETYTSAAVLVYQE